jgi:SAM-dependent methyltransferase
VKGQEATAPGGCPSSTIPLTPYSFQGDEVPCPVCGASGAEPMARIDRRLKRLTTVLCGTCGVFYTNPMPTQAELDAYYRDTYRRDYQFVRHFAVHGHQAHGFEPGVAYAAHAAGAGSVEIRTGTWAGMDYAEGSFDAITCLHVLEHLREPVAALRAMARWLTPDGLLYLEVPDMQGYELKGFEHFHFAHVIGFSSDNLVLAGKNAGLGVVERLKGTSILFSKAAPEATIDLPPPWRGTAPSTGAASACRPTLATTSGG